MDNRNSVVGDFYTEWNTASERICPVDSITVFSADPYAPYSLAFTHDGTRLLSGGVSKLIRVWSVPDFKLLHEVQAHDNSVNSMVITSDDSTLITCSTDTTVKVWSLPNIELVETLLDRKKTVAAVGLSHDEQYFAAAYYGGRVTIWNRAFEQIVGIKANDRNVVSAILARDNSVFVTGGLTNVVSVWEFPSGKKVTELEGHRTAAFPIKFVDEGKTLVTQGYEQAIRLWDTATWECTRVIPSPATPIRNLAYSPGRSRLALATEGKVLLLDPQSWEVMDTLTIGTKATAGVAFSHDNRYIVVGAADGNAYVWELG